MKMTNYIMVYLLIIAQVTIQASDETETVKSIAKQAINCVYNQDGSIKETCLKHQSLSEKASEAIKKIYAEDENFKVMQTNEMTMREIEKFSIITQIKPSKSSEQRWQVTTNFTLHLVKDHVEIRRTMQNVQQLETKGKTNTPVTIETFTTKVLGNTLIIDHLSEREKNCKQSKID